jgi:hypothetical protein
MVHGRRGQRLALLRRGDWATFMAPGRWRAGVDSGGVIWRRGKAIVEELVNGGHSAYGGKKAARASMTSLALTQAIG